MLSTKYSTGLPAFICARSAPDTLLLEGLRSWLGVVLLSNQHTIFIRCALINVLAARVCRSRFHAVVAFNWKIQYSTAVGLVSPGFQLTFIHSAVDRYVTQTCRTRSPYCCPSSATNLLLPIIDVVVVDTFIYIMYIIFWFVTRAGSRKRARLSSFAPQSLTCICWRQQPAKKLHPSFYEKRARIN